MLNGEPCTYAFCTTVLAAFQMRTGRLREYDLTSDGDVKDWCGHVFRGTKGSYETHGALPGHGYRNPRPSEPVESDFYIGYP